MPAHRSYACKESLAGSAVKFSDNLQAELREIARHKLFFRLIVIKKFTTADNSKIKIGARCQIIRQKKF